MHDAARLGRPRPAADPRASPPAAPMAAPQAGPPDRVTLARRSSRRSVLAAGGLVAIGGGLALGCGHARPSRAGRPALHGLPRAAGRRDPADDDVLRRADSGHRCWPRGGSRSPALSQRPASWTLDELRGLGEADLTAILDCTSGWWIETGWHGVPLGALHRCGGSQARRGARGRPLGDGLVDVARRRRGASLPPRDRRRGHSPAGWQRRPAPTRRTGPSRARLGEVGRPDRGRLTDAAAPQPSFGSSWRSVCAPANRSPELAPRDRRRSGS